MATQAMTSAAAAFLNRTGWKALVFKKAEGIRAGYMKASRCNVNGSIGYALRKIKRGSIDVSSAILPHMAIAYVEPMRASIDDVCLCRDSSGTGASPEVQGDRHRGKRRHS